MPSSRRLPAPLALAAMPAASAHGLWIVLAAFAGGLVLLLVVLLALGRRPGRQGRAGEDGDRPPASAASSSGRPGSPAEGWELAVLTFRGLHGAEQAFAGARGRSGDQAWTRDVAFVEAHHHGRIVLRGTLAGRYVDIPDLTDASPEDGPLLTALHESVPEGCSALTALAPPDRVRPVVDALGAGARRVHRHRVTAAEAPALARVVAGAPITPTG